MSVLAGNFSVKLIVADLLLGWYTQLEKYINKEVLGVEQ
jgi:hypothetical protein